MNILQKTVNILIKSCIYLIYYLSISYFIFFFHEPFSLFNTGFAKYALESRYVRDHRLASNVNFANMPYFIIHTTIIWSFGVSCALAAIFFFFFFFDVNVTGYIQFIQLILWEVIYGAIYYFFIYWKGKNVPKKTQTIRII